MARPKDKQFQKDYEHVKGSVARLANAMNAREEMESHLKPKTQKKGLVDWKSSPTPKVLLGQDTDKTPQMSANPKADYEAHQQHVKQLNRSWREADDRANQMHEQTKQWEEHMTKLLPERDFAFRNK